MAEQLDIIDKDISKIKFYVYLKNSIKLYPLSSSKFFYKVYKYFFDECEKNFKKDIPYYENLKLDIEESQINIKTLIGKTKKKNLVNIDNQKISIKYYLLVILDSILDKSDMYHTFWKNEFINII